MNSKLLVKWFARTYGKIGEDVFDGNISGITLNNMARHMSKDLGTQVYYSVSVV